MDDELEQARLDGVRLRDMGADEVRRHFDRCLGLLDEARDDWSSTYVGRLARLLYRRLEELGAVSEAPAPGDVAMGEGQSVLG